MKRLPLYHRPIFAKRILEVGGGHAPYQDVTHAVDKFPEDNAERASNLVVPEGVVFQQGDLEEIPFQSEPKFDFIYASHVFEHVVNPEKAVSEVNRTSKRGYIETPSPLREQISCPFPFSPSTDFHRFFCWTGKNKDTLHVAHKSAATLGDFCKCPNGHFAQFLFELTRSQKVEIESILPGAAKTSKLHFNTPLRLSLHNSLREACDSGNCAYSSAKVARTWGTLPLALVSRRFRRLHRVIKNNFTRRG